MVAGATTSLMDRIFSIFRAYSTELNSMLGLSELFITATEPQVTKRTTQNPASRAICVQSNIATSFFRLVIEGKQDTISFYLIPTNSTLSLNEVSLRCSALSSWKAHFGARDHVIWESPEGILTEELLNVACLDLIRHLIDASLEVSEQEHTVQNHDMSGGFLEVDPRPPERTGHAANQEISAVGTSTDSLSSLASLQTGVFETVGKDLESPSVKSLFEQDQLPVPVVETYELAKPEQTWQPVDREQTDFGKPNVAQSEDEDQVVAEVAKKTDFGKPNVPWQPEQQDKIVPAKPADFGKPNFPWQQEQKDQMVPEVAKRGDLGKPDFPWLRDQQDKIVPELARRGDLGKPNFPWLRDQQGKIVPEVAKLGDFGKPDSPLQHEQQEQIVPEVAVPGGKPNFPCQPQQHDQIVPELAKQTDFAKLNFPPTQNQIDPVVAIEQGNLVEPNITETAIESAEGDAEKVLSFYQKKESHGDVEENNTSKKGVTGKRLTRKMNSRRNRKKRNEKNKRV